MFVPSPWTGISAASPASKLLLAHLNLYVPGMGLAAVGLQGFWRRRRFLVQDLLQNVHVVSAGTLDLADPKSSSDFLFFFILLPPFTAHL